MTTEINPVRKTYLTSGRTIWKEYRDENHVLQLKFWSRTLYFSPEEAEDATANLNREVEEGLR